MRAIEAAHLTMSSRIENEHRSMLKVRYLLRHLIWRRVCHARGQHCSYHKKHTFVLTFGFDDGPANQSARAHITSCDIRTDLFVAGSICRAERRRNNNSGGDNKYIIAVVLSGDQRPHLLRAVSGLTCGKFDLIMLSQGTKYPLDISSHIATVKTVGCRPVNVEPSCSIPRIASRKLRNSRCKHAS